MPDDMLIVAQLETGNLDFKGEEINLSQFLEEIVEEFQAIHRNTHQVAMKSNFYGTAMLDPRLLRQIAANLISNAIKYSPRGSEICVLVQSSDTYIELLVQDKGIGIPEADQASLFKPFQRASNVGRVSGTGVVICPWGSAALPTAFALPISPPKASRSWCQIAFAGGLVYDRLSTNWIYYSIPDTLPDKIYCLTR